VDSNSQDDADSCPLQKKIESFQDFVGWQKSMDLVTESYLLVDRLPQNERYELASQMRRAAVSIPANIAEGFGRWHSKEFVHFLIGKRLGFFSAPELAKPVSLVEEIGRMLAAL
jgi:hypothetical protein